MVKFTGERDGKHLVGFGLSAGNLEKLREGKPILVDLSEMIPGCKMEVLIFYGVIKCLLHAEKNAIESEISDAAAAVIVVE